MITALLSNFFFYNENNLDYEFTENYSDIHKHVYDTDEPTDVIRTNTVPKFKEFISFLLLSANTLRAYNLYPFLACNHIFEKLFKSQVLFLNRIGNGARHNNIVNLHYYHLRKSFKLKKFSRRLSIYTLLNIIVMSCLHYDLILLHNFIKRTLQSISFKRHKRVLSLLRRVFKRVIVFFIKKQQILGFMFYVSGKIGLKGSVKTRSFALNYGTVSKTFKSLSLRYEVGDIWTRSGVLGLRTAIFFNKNYFNFIDILPLRLKIICLKNLKPFFVYLPTGLIFFIL